ncbi:MAG: hypothetical protein ACK4VI_06160 [Alphaproteobacteria bacterium]
MGKNYNPRNAAAAFSILLTMAFTAVASGLGGYVLGQQNGFEKGYTAAINENPTATVPSSEIN